MPILSSVLGNSQKLDGGAMFGNAPKALWQRWLAPDEHNRIDLSCRALLVREPGRLSLIETGIGAFFSPDLKQRYGVQESHHVLLESLQAQGVSHEDIDLVVLTHLHFDHAGGLLAGWQEGQAERLLFPNATIVTGAEQWRRATQPHTRDRASYIPELMTLLEQSGRLYLLERAARSDFLGDNWRLHWSDGHTPGQLIVELVMPDGPVIYPGDLIPGRAWLHLPITMGYDRFPEGLIDEKEAFLFDWSQRGARLVFTHDPEVAMGRVSRGPKGRYELIEESNSLEMMAI